MKRWLFHVTAGVSLLLFLGTAGLWVHSHFYHVRCNVHFLRQPLEFQLVHGQMMVQVIDYFPEQAQRWFARPYLVQQPRESAAQRSARSTSAPTFTRASGGINWEEMFHLMIGRTDYRFMGFGFGSSEDRRLAVQEIARQTARAQLLSRDRPTAASPPIYRGTVYAITKHRVIFPLWFVMLLSGVCPAWWIYTWRRRRVRHAAGLCRKCGYDLRATPTRCPECGTETGLAAA